MTSIVVFALIRLAQGQANIEGFAGGQCNSANQLYETLSPGECSPITKFNLRSIAVDGLHPSQYVVLVSFSKPAEMNKAC
jgi:uncharacterized membrane-anchored protein